MAGWRDVAILQNQEARTIRHTRSLAFDCPLRHGYEEGVEVRTLLPAEQLEEEREGCTVLTDADSDGNRYTKFWVHASPDSHQDEGDVQHMFEGQSITDPMCARRAPPTTETPMLGE